MLFRSLDAQGNPVIGQASSLKDAVTMPNATLKSGSGWTDNRDGTYTATYTADKAGENLQATLRLAEWTESSTSKAYAITHGQAAQAGSSVLVDGSSFVSGSDMTVFVSLLDAQGNPVIGQASSLTDAVTVPGAALKGEWSETPANSGVYTATYTAQTAGTALQAKLTLDGWTKSLTSNAYDIHVLEFSSITVNDHQFSVNDGFPTTGFVGATFTLNLKDGASASNFDWKVDGGAGWVSVNNGVVRFTGKGTSSTVTITVTPKTGGG